MKIFAKKQLLKNHITNLKLEKISIGFVPTMGALHKGHLSLIENAKSKNKVVIVSIFVNPTQFNNLNDLNNYPKTLEKDITLLQSISCDILFVPSVEEIYAENISAENFDFDGLEHEMEGKFREGHFNGVGTIVKAFFEIINPDVAYFGEKDFQQLQIIKKLVEKYQMNISVKGLPIFREKDGLAMSSRNARLTPEHREASPFIYSVLLNVQKEFSKKNSLELNNWVNQQFEKHALFGLEYFFIADEKTLKPIKSKESDKNYRAFIAVFAGEIRLIDNIPLGTL